MAPAKSANIRRFPPFFRDVRPGSANSISRRPYIARRQIPRPIFDLPLPATARLRFSAGDLRNPWVCVIAARAVVWFFLASSVHLVPASSSRAPAEAQNRLVRGLHSRSIGKPAGIVGGPVRSKFSPGNRRNSPFFCGEPWPRSSTLMQEPGRYSPSGGGECSQTSRIGRAGEKEMGKERGQSYASATPRLTRQYTAEIQRSQRQSNSERADLERLAQRQ
jgi:hypothetical protein